MWIELAIGALIVIVWSGLMLWNMNRHWKRKHGKGFFE